VRSFFLALAGIVFGLGAGAGNLSGHITPAWGYALVALALMMWAVHGVTQQGARDWLRRKLGRGGSLRIVVPVVSLITFPGVFGLQYWLWHEEKVYPTLVAIEHPDFRNGQRQMSVGGPDGPKYSESRNGEWVEIDEVTFHAPRPQSPKRDLLLVSPNKTMEAVRIRITHVTGDPDPASLEQLFSASWRDYQSISPHLPLNIGQIELKAPKDQYQVEISSKEGTLRYTLRFELHRDGSWHTEYVGQDEDLGNKVFEKKGGL
jgi:hypothetical protein